MNIKKVATLTILTLLISNPVLANTQIPVSIKKTGNFFGGEIDSLATNVSSYLLEIAKKKCNGPVQYLENFKMEIEGGVTVRPDITNKNNREYLMIGFPLVSASAIAICGEPEL